MSIQLQLRTITAPGHVDIIDLGPAHPANVRARDVQAWMTADLEAYAHLYDEDGAVSAERLAEEAAQRFGIYEDDGSIPEYVWTAAVAVAGGGR
jgi:hypothetical protein